MNYYDSQSRYKKNAYPIDLNARVQGKKLRKEKRREFSERRKIYKLSKKEKFMN